MEEAKIHRVGIIMNGVTGRMGTNQHLMRSIVEIIREGGIKTGTKEIIMPDPVLVGRNSTKLEYLAGISGIKKFTTDLDSLWNNPDYPIYFDAQTTGLRVSSVLKAIEHGKHIYCEKPVATTSAEATGMYLKCKAAGLKHGVVQDKLWLPGIIKLKNLIDEGFFGTIISVRGEFGYWVFEGDIIPSQRPSWNYKKEEQGGIMLDMLSHWRYVLDNVFGKVRSISCTAATHIPKRVDEYGNPYNCTADDSAYATFEIEGGIIAQFNSSWCVRVRRDDLLTIQVDGTKGSAVAGLRDCYMQHYGMTPKPVWNPDVPQSINFYDNWAKVPEQKTFPNAFRAQWELFLRHIVYGSPFQWDLREGAKGVQLAELGMESWQKRCWMDIPELPE